jgi:enamine deaminase RidA (YjgF/YER057c/UK114 family)
MAQAFNTPGVAEPFGIFSGAAWQPQGKVLHISGQTAKDADGNVTGVGDITAQTHQVLGNIKKILEYAGGTMSDIARVTVYVIDMSMLDEIHRVRSEYFSPPYPASTLVQVSRLVHSDYLIEIEAVAVIPLDRVKDRG